MIPISIFIIGLILGSFFNVCIYRIPRGGSINFPPSHCPECRHGLKPLDLIPLASFIFLRGKCRYCGSKISFRYPIVEFITGSLLLALYFTYSITWLCMAYTLLTSILIIASFIDLEHLIIPNKLILFGLIIGIVFTITISPIRWHKSLLGLLVGGGCLWLTMILGKIIFKKEGMGGGDIKLMAMIGLFLGWEQALIVLLLAIYISFIFILGTFIFKAKKIGDYIPFGPFIALGGVLSILYGGEILRFLRSFLLGM